MERCIAVVKIMRSEPVFRDSPDHLANDPGVFAVAIERSERRALCSLSWAESTHDYAQHPDERLVSGTWTAYQAHLRDCLTKPYNSDGRDAWFQRLRQLPSMRRYYSFDDVTQNTTTVVSELARKLGARFRPAAPLTAAPTPAPLAAPLLGIASIVRRGAVGLAFWIAHHFDRAGCDEMVLYWYMDPEETRPATLDGRVRSFEASEAIAEGQGRIWWKRYTHTLPAQHIRTIENSTAVESQLFMPEQAHCFKHASRRFNTTWMLFVDLDEFVRGDVLQLLSLMQARPNRPDGLWLPQLQMTTSNECLTPRPHRDHNPIEFKHLVRRAALHPDASFFGSIHDIALAPGTFSAKIYPHVVAIAHFRYRKWNIGAQKVRLKELGCFPKPKDPWQRYVCRFKDRETSDWGWQLHARTRTRLGGTHELTPLRPTGARVLIVAEMRSGSTWFGQRVFGARSDVLYVYEPCRVFNTGSECAGLISRLVDCQISLRDWRLLRKDRDARYVHSTLGAYDNFQSFLDMCYSRHLVMKVVRNQYVTRETLGPSDMLIVHLHRPAASVMRSRNRMLPDGASMVMEEVVKHQAKMRGMANVTISLDDVSKDPEGVALRLHRLAGMVPLHNISCERPNPHGWTPCAGWQRKLFSNDYLGIEV